MRKKIVAGNWKMNTLPAEGVELAKGIAAGRGEVCSCVNFIVCPPFTHLSQVAEALKGSDIALGAQDCATEAKGAYTGEIAASMIAALGCKYVILGHSERRQYYGETSATLNKKMAQAYANGLTPIYCVGENLEEREAGKHFDVVKAQIEEVVYNLTEEEYKNLVIAYEPVWAIGTGKTASAEQAQEIHAYIRQVLAAKFGAAAQDTAILYGGSCKPSNAAEIFAKEDVDGGAELVRVENGLLDGKVSYLYMANSAITYPYKPTQVDEASYYYKVKITGSLEGKETGSAECFLINGSEKLSDWKKVDLSALGKVDCLTFSPASNEANAYGLLVPAYFAIDEIGLIAEK